MMTKGLKALLPVDTLRQWHMCQGDVFPLALHEWQTVHQLEATHTALSHSLDLGQA